MEIEASGIEQSADPPGESRRILTIAGAGITILYALTSLGHWSAMIPRGTDSTWLRQLHELFRSDAVFGRDVVWTFGPWGFLYRFATPETTMYVLAGRAFLAISCALGVWTLSRSVSSNPIWRCLWSLACIAAITLGEPNLSVFAPALVLLVLAVSRTRANRGILITLAIATALASLVKISAGIASGCVVALITLHDIWRRRAPWSAIAYSAGLLVFWLFARQPIGAIPDFVRNGWEISRAYAQAMAAESIAGPDVIQWFLASGGLVVAIAMIARWRDDRIAGCALAGAMALWLFVVFKGSCIRQDQHMLFAGPSALLAGLLVGTQVRKRWWALGSVSLALVLAWLTTASGLGDGWQIPREVVRSVTGIPASFAWLGQRLIGSDNWPGGQGLWFEPGSQPDLAGLKTPIDVYPFAAFDLKKLGIERRLRPVMEAYQTTTPRLSALNAKFLASPAAAKTLLWHVFAMDGHQATMEDALSWREVLARYDFREQRGNYLVLTRSANPRRYELIPLKTVEASLDEPVAVPQSPSGMVWLSIDLTPSVWLKARTFLYKPPVTHLDIEESGSGDQSCRLIPEMASGGFLLSPLVYKNDTFRALFPGQDREVLKKHQVLKVNLSAGYPGESTGYERRVTYHFSELRFSSELNQHAAR